MKKHSYRTILKWTGNTGSGTSGYRAYGRNHTIEGPNKENTIAGSSDPHFRGEKGRYNPEELLVASLSACHMLSYLHVCAINDVVVVDYADEAEGEMEEAEDGSGRMTRAILRPRVTVSPSSDTAKAQALHDEARRLCFIANSVNFPVVHEPSVQPAS
jgi:organic hydroperoxide reductase OsmC/OhrA